MDKPQPRPEADPQLLISAYLDGDATPGQLDALERWINTSDANAAEFVRRGFADQDIRTHLIAEQSSQLIFVDDDTDADIMSEVVDQALALRRQHEIEDEANRQLAAQQAEDARNRRFELRREPEPDRVRRVVIIPHALIWLGLAAVLGIAATVVMQSDSTPRRDTSTPPVIVDDRDHPAPVLATLVRSLDARWANDAGGGSDLRQGEHTLVEGLVEIKLADGVGVVLEGPVSFVLTGRNALTLTDGRLVANVPPAASGFTVDTPATRIIDYGTAFGVHAAAEGPTSVQVYQGEVQVEPDRAQASAGLARDEGGRRLRAGQAVQVNAEGERIVPVAFDGLAFALAATPQARALRAYGQAVQTAAPLYYWPLELTPAQALGRGTVPGQPDLVIAGEPEVIQAGSRSYVRFDGASTGPSQALYTAERLPGLDGASELSIEVWARPKRYHRGIIFNFYDPGPGNTRGFSDHLAFLEFVGNPFEQESQTERNKLSFWLNALGTTGKPGEVISPTPYPLHQWMHIVAILREGQMLLFVDGQRVASHTVRPAFSMAPAMCMGVFAKDLFHPSTSPGVRSRQMAGDLDEVAIYGYALPPDEISEHYRRMIAVLEAEAAFTSD